MRLIVTLILLLQFTSAVAGPELNNDAPILENKGQWDNSVNYRVEIPSGFLYIRNDGLSIFPQNLDHAVPI